MSTHDFRGGLPSRRDLGYDPWVAMNRLTSLVVCGIAVMAFACDEPSRFSVGHPIGSCEVSDGRCLDSCWDFPRVLSCAGDQRCDFTDGQCRPAASVELPASATPCGINTCLAGSQCAPNGVCLLRPFAEQLVCDIVSNCWGSPIYRRRAPPLVPPPLLNPNRLPDGEVLDVRASRSESGDNLSIVIRRPDELSLVRIDPSGQDERVISTVGFVTDAVADLFDEAHWIAVVDGIAFEYRWGGSTGIPLGPASVTPRWWGRGDFGVRNWCLMTESSRFWCGGQQVDLLRPVATGEVFARRRVPASFDPDYDPNLPTITAFLLARQGELSLALSSYGSSFVEEYVWANFSANIVQVVRDITGLVYVLLDDGQVIELSSEGEELRVVMNHPGRVGRITIGQDGNLYFVAGRDVGAPAILDRVRLPDGYF